MAWVQGDATATAVQVTVRECHARRSCMPAAPHASDDAWAAGCTAAAHRTKALFEGRGSPALKARMATVRAVLIRGFCANLEPNSWRHEGHALFLDLFTRSCRQHERVTDAPRG